MMWRILQIEEDVIYRGRKPSWIKAPPRSILVLVFNQNIVTFSTPNFLVDFLLKNSPVL